MPYEYTPPKYAQVVAEIQRRIESGEYPPGSMLPSEHQLSDESRLPADRGPRAAGAAADGWIETQQVRAVRARTPCPGRAGNPRPGEEALNRDESDEPGELIEAGVTAPPARWPHCSAWTTARARLPGGDLSGGRGSLRDRHLVGSSALADGTDLAATNRCWRVRAHLPGARRPR